VRIAFFGLPLAALLLHRDGHEIAYAALCRPSVGTRRLKRALGEARVAVKPDVMAAKTIARVRALGPERIVSWFWTTKLPPEMLAIAPAFGVHPSLLPRHRGPDPYFWAIDAGDTSTGVTAHRIAGEYDTGAILAQEALAIDPAWNAWQLAKALDRPSLALLRRVARDPAAFERASSQDEALATLAPSPADEELEIDWTWTSERIARRVRAAAPSPGAWAFFGDEPVTLTRAIPAARFPRALAPGEAAVQGDVAVVRTGDGALALLEGRMDAAEGEEPHAIEASDFVALVEELTGAAHAVHAESARKEPQAR
jgi:methionyl-tRNA formyltransferase